MSIELDDLTEHALWKILSPMIHVSEKRRAIYKMMLWTGHEELLPGILKTEYGVDNMSALGEADLADLYRIVRAFCDMHDNDCNNVVYVGKWAQK